MATIQKESPRLDALRARQAVHVFAIAAIALCLLLSFFLRSGDIKDDAGAPNLETPWHALLTVHALSESSVATHWYLPIVTLGGPRDKRVPWGASNSDTAGNYYYTSATAPTFVLPLVWFRLFQQQPSIETLAYFNFALQAASVLLLYVFLYTLLRYFQISERAAAFSAIIGTSISIFSREALLAFGVVYWFHSIYQVVLTATLYVLLLALAGPRPIAWWKIVLLSVLCFAGAWIEWTGFTFNLGAAVILVVFARGKEGLRFLGSLMGTSAVAAAVYAIWRSKLAGLVGGVLVGGSILLGLASTYRRSREIALLAACMIGSSVLAALVIVSHYATIVDLPTLIWRMRARLEARSAFAHGGTLDNILLLVQGYGLSYGPFLLVLALCAVYLWKASIEPAAKRLLILMLLAAAIPLSENIVLMENSGEFSYARLKFVVPAAMVIAVALAYSEGIRRTMLAAAVALACVLGYWTYREDLTFYAGWRAIDARNKAFRDSLKSDPNFECSVLVTKAITRGYGTLLFHKMIYETWAFANADSEKEYLAQAIGATSACQGIYLKAKLPNTNPPFTNMAEYTGALILTKDGQTRTVDAPATRIEQAEPSWYVQLFSYRGRKLLDRGDAAPDRRGATP